MTFPGKFTDSLVAGSLEKVSLSFLVDGLEVRRGGCAANIAFGMANLGLQPILIAAVGKDWADYEAWLSRHGVDKHKVPTEFCQFREQQEWGFINYRSIHEQSYGSTISYGLTSTCEAKIPRGGW